MKERVNYETMRKAAHLYIKEICGDQDDHGDQASLALITMITPILTGSSWPEVLPEGCGAR
jgi:hypothetical protein